MYETKTGQQAAQLHECYMMMITMMLTMNNGNKLLELQSNVKYETTKRAAGKEVSSSRNYPVCTIERVHLRTFKSLNLNEVHHKTCSQLRSLFVVSTKH
jgi:hypothetical protein